MACALFVGVVTIAAADDGHGGLPSRLELIANDDGLTGVLIAENDLLLVALARENREARKNPDWFESETVLVQDYLTRILIIESDGVGLVPELLSIEGEAVRPDHFETTLGVRLPWTSRPEVLRIQCQLVSFAGRTIVTVSDNDTGAIRSDTVSRLMPVAEIRLPPVGLRVPVEPSANRDRSESEGSAEWEAWALGVCAIASGIGIGRLLWRKQSG